MAIEDEIIHGEIFGSSDTPQPQKPKKEKVYHAPKTMAEATSGLKNLDAKKKKSKSGTFAKGTHGSGAAKMRAEYKNRKRKESEKRNSQNL